MNGKKLLVYPYSMNASVLAVYAEFLKDYKITALVTPKGWLAEGSDGSNIDNRQPIGIAVLNQFEEGLQLCETVLVADGDYKDRFRERILRNILKAMQEGRDIICALPLSDEEYKKLARTAIQQKTLFHSIVQEQDERQITKVEELYTPQVPVVFVGELVEDCNGFDVALGLTLELRNKGYVVTTIADSNYCSLFQLHSTPSFLRKQLPEWDKIIYLNSYIQQLNEEETPDVFVIEIPGGMVRFNEQAYGDFGIYTFYYMKALTPDFLVTTFPFNYVNEEIVDNINRDFENQYGFGLDIVAMSNRSVDADAITTQGKIDMNCLSQDIVFEKEKETAAWRTPVVNASSVDAKGKICSIICDILQNGTNQAI